LKIVKDKFMLFKFLKIKHWAIFCFTFMPLIIFDIFNNSDYYDNFDIYHLVLHSYILLIIYFYFAVLIFFIKRTNSSIKGFIFLIFCYLLAIISTLLLNYYLFITPTHTIPDEMIIIFSFFELLIAFCLYYTIFFISKNITKILLNKGIALKDYFIN
jgi:hypothetical protein